MQNPWKIECDRCPAASACFNEFVVAAGQAAADESLRQSYATVVDSLQASYGSLRAADAIGGTEKLEAENRENLRRYGVELATTESIAAAKAKLQESTEARNQSDDIREELESGYRALTTSCAGPKIKMIGGFTIIRCNSENRDAVPRRRQAKVRRTTFADRFDANYGQ